MAAAFQEYHEASDREDMIRYLEHDEIDEKKWDECIRQSFNGNLYGHYWFLDVVAGEWGALVEDDYKRVFPLPHRRKYRLSYIYQPFFTQQLGLYTTSKLSSKMADSFLDAIPKKFRHIEVNLNIHNKVTEGKFRMIPQRNHELDLIHSYDKIYSGYSENLKRNLKKAEKAGLTILKNPRPEVVVDLFRENRGRSIPHLKDEDFRRLLQMVYRCTYKGLADIRGVYDARNQLLAGAYFIRSHKKAIFLFSGLSEEGRKHSAMPFLIDSYIHENANKHMTFDFDGSNDPNLARFYKSFGSKEIIYQRVVINRLPWLASVGYRLLRGR
jgi:hypothetical protein